MRTVRDIPILENIPVLVRTALNVPIENGRVTSPYRLERSLPTIVYLAKKGARIILISHVGEQGTETLAPIAKELGRFLPNVTFFPENTGVGVRRAARELLPGHILVLENLRRNRGEQENSSVFSHEIASVADVFVQDSFDTCHRHHASIVGIPDILPSYAGLVLEEEITKLSQALVPKHPALAIVGGAKFNTKEPVLKKLLSVYDSVFVGGALANDFLKASGCLIGESLTSNSSTSHIAELLGNKKLMLPVDALVTSPESSSSRITDVHNIRPNETIVDHGPATIALLSEIAQKSKTVLWNGPLGKYENGYSDATDKLALAIARTHTHSIVGGGDTVAAIEKLGIVSNFSFVSTGGGAMLEFLSRGTLPGIEALH